MTILTAGVETLKIVFLQQGASYRKPPESNLGRFVVHMEGMKAFLIEEFMNFEILYPLIVLLPQLAWVY
jgi:hypothetical protein